MLKISEITHRGLGAECGLGMLGPTALSVTAVHNSCCWR